MKNRSSILSAALIICVLICATHVRAAKKSVHFDTQTHAVDFSKAVPGHLNYQGYLADATDSSGITATLEMTFRLFDSETKGAELWSETHPAVDVAEGLFDVQLGSVTPFPPGLFDGNTLWLQTEIVAETLSPRKPVVSTAYSQKSGEADHSINADHAATAAWASDAQHAIYADTADYTLSGVGWTVDGDNVYHETGKVGIGTVSPLTELDVNGSVNATTYYGDGSNLTGVSGASDNDWTVTGPDMFSNVPGNVGIGVTNPGAKLQVVHSSGNYGIMANSSYGVYGRHVGSGNFGHLGSAGYGVYGYCSTPKDGRGLPTGTSAIYGEAQGVNSSALYAVHADSLNLGVLGHPDYAGYFDGDVEVTGDLAIGVAVSAYPLNVGGMANMLEFRMPTGAATGYVLTSDVSGVGTWEPGWWLRDDDPAVNWIFARNAPPFRVYDDSTLYVGLCYVQDCSPSAVTNWSNGGANIRHCYAFNGQAYGVRASVYSDSNDIAVYGRGDEWGGYFSCFGTGTALYAESSDTTRYGMLGSSDYGIYGQYGTGKYGILGSLDYGVAGGCGSSANGDHGIWGLQSANASGSGYYHLDTHCGVLGRAGWGLNYNCGVQGATYLFDAGNRISGVIGIFTDNNNIWGSLAYQSSGNLNYGGYATAWGGGVGKGEGASGIGFGAWGDLFGADIHGRVYGTYTEGGDYALYSNGAVFKNDLDVHLQPADDRSMNVLYTNVSTDVTVQTSGYCRLSGGMCSVAFDDHFTKVVSPDVPVVVTVTPIGSSNGVYIADVDQNGFRLVENNQGKSDVQVAFIAIGRRAGYEDPELPQEVISADYVDKLSRGLHNDADTSTDGEGLYYENDRLYVGHPPAIVSQPERSREEEQPEIRLPRRPRRIEQDDLNRDNLVR
jgi:hypothetical protein